MICPDQDVFGADQKSRMEDVGTEFTLELADSDDPADWALVEMKVIPMCTEYKAWLRGPGVPGTRINALGHEGVGEVVEVAHPCGVEVGDRVLFAKYGGTEIKHNGTKYLIMCESDILAKVIN